MAGPQAVLHGKRLVFSPQRVLVDVANHHPGLAERRSATRARTWADGQTDHSAVVRGGQIGGGTVLQQAVLVKQQNRSHRAGYLRLQKPDRVRELLRQRLATHGRLAQPAHLGGKVFGALAGRDVFGNGHERNQCPMGIAPSRNADPREHDFAVFMHVAFVAHRVVACPALHFGQHGAVAGLLVRVGHGGGRHGQQFGFGVAQHVAIGGVGRQKPAVRRTHGHAHGRPCKHLPGALNALVKRGRGHRGGIGAFGWGWG